MSRPANADIRCGNSCSNALAVGIALLLLGGLGLAVTIGSQTRPWTWGPALLIFGIALVAALPAIWKMDKAPEDIGFLGIGLTTAAWFAWRAYTSPVADLGNADLMLLIGACAAFVCMRAIGHSKLAESIFIWGVAILLLANVAVIGIQVGDPTFSPVYQAPPAQFPSGFYTHYNEAANYLIASSLFVGAAALTQRQGGLTRVIWALISVAGIISIYYTRSRGGILAGAVGSVVLACGALVIGKRSSARWFPPAMVAFPLLGLLITLFLFTGWKDAQAIRNADTSVDHLLDSSYRLFFLGIAASCIALHPLVGGGSRSYSWESFRFSDVGIQGMSITRKPEYVHNEIVQAATDYGLIGAVLLIIFLAWAVGFLLFELLFSKESDLAKNGWRLGGLAGLAGMLTQSCFTFVFHLIPGTILLGICLAQISRTYKPDARPWKVITAKTLLSFGLIACLAAIIPIGWKGIEVTRALWPTYFGKAVHVSSEIQINALTEAIAIWPQFTFYKDRAALYQSMAAQAGALESDFLAKAIQDYQAAERLHPLDAGIVVNLANLLSQTQQDSAAELAYQRAIRLQGGSETAFLSHISFSKHLVQKASRRQNPTKPSESLIYLEEAALQMEKSVQQMSWSAPDINATRVTTHENLGIAREANGHNAEALAAYDFARHLIGGARVTFRTAAIIAKMGTAEWAARRPANALGHYLEASRRLTLTNDLPSDITVEQRLELQEYLNKRISFLTTTKVKPVPFPIPDEN